MAADEAPPCYCQQAEAGEEHEVLTCEGCHGRFHFGEYECDSKIGFLTCMQRAPPMAPC